MAGVRVGVEDLVRASLLSLLALPDVCRTGLALAEGGGRRLRFTASHSGPLHDVEWCHIDAYDDVPLTTVVRTGRPLLGPLDALDPRYADYVAAQLPAVVALAALPLTAAGTPFGGLLLLYDRPQEFGPAQLEALTRKAADLAQRLRQSQASTARRVAWSIAAPVEPGALLAHARIDNDARAVGVARRFLRDWLVEWAVGDDAIDSAVLCLSELVTNAVIHTEAPCDVRVSLAEGLVTVLVRDRGSDGPVTSPSQVEVLDPLRVHGRGLQLVEALSRRWGSELDAVGTTVWFALDA